MTATLISTTAQAGEFVATEIAWWGCCSERSVSEKLAQAGHLVAAADVLAFAVEVGLVKQSVMGFTASRKTNAKVFGRKFADFVGWPVMASQHDAAVTFAGGRYPFKPICSCGWTTWGYVSEHAARGVAEQPRRQGEKR